MAFNTDNSIVDYLTSNKQDASFASRQKLAADNGVTDYTGTAEQNMALLQTLKTKAGAGATGSGVSDNPVAGASSLVDANTPITSTELNNGTSLPEPSTFLGAAGGNKPNINDSISTVAKTVLTGTQKAIDDLNAQKLAQVEADKAAAATDVKNVQGELNTIKNSTQLQDNLKTINEKFKTDQTIQQLTEVQTKIAQAQDALNVGLAYEEGRPARLQLVSGRMLTLKNQGLATIGALQGVASVLQGNLNLAKAYADQTLGAIKDDNDRSMTALNTLLTLANNKLVDLTKEERATVDLRIKSLSDEADRLEKDKNDIQDLMVKYPDEFLKGGVTLLDTKEQALAKILPRLAITERLKLAKQLAGGVDAGKLTPVQIQTLKNEMLDNKGKGLTYDQAIQHYGAVLDIAYINSVYPDEAARAKAIEDPLKTLTDDYYSQFLDSTTGNVKPGYTITIDPKNGRPIVEKSAAAGSGFWANVGKIFSNVF